MSDDDWFDRALREDEERDGEDRRGVDDGESGTGGSGSEDEEARDGGSEGDEGMLNGVSDDRESRDFGGDADSDGELFADDFAAAFERAGATGDAGPSGGGGPVSSDDPFDGDPFGELDAPGSEGDAPAGAPGVDAAAEGGSFEDTPGDIDPSRIALGIEGLDAMIQDGIPERSLIAAIGSAGTGKTTLGLQFLSEGLRNGERGIFITLEQSYDEIVDTATARGWPFDEYVEDGDLAIVDLDPIEMSHSLASIRNDLPRLVREYGASRLVLDSVSLLEMMYENRSSRRNEIYDFTRSLKASGVTTLLTSEASEETPYASRYGIVEYLTDAVIVLHYIREDDFQQTRLAVEIQKIRNANHSRETKPYEITSEGITVYRQANIF